MGASTEIGTRDLYFLPRCVSRWYKTRLILCACRTVGFSRFRRLRVKILHNVMSKKSRIDKVFGKLQHKVRGIFVRDEIFENSSQTQRICKGMHIIPYVYRCQSFVFALCFQKCCPEQKYLGLYVVTLRILYRFLVFWTQNYVDFSRGGA